MARNDRAQRSGRPRRDAAELAVITLALAAATGAAADTAVADSGPGSTGSPAAQTAGSQNAGSQTSGSQGSGDRDDSDDDRAVTAAAAPAQPAAAPAQPAAPPPAAVAPKPEPAPKPAAKPKPASAPVAPAAPSGNSGPDESGSSWTGGRGGDDDDDERRPSTSASNWSQGSGGKGSSGSKKSKGPERPSTPASTPAPAQGGTGSGNGSGSGSGGRPQPQGSSGRDRDDRAGTSGGNRDRSGNSGRKHDDRGNGGGKHTPGGGTRPGVKPSRPQAQPSQPSRPSQPSPSPAPAATSSRPAPSPSPIERVVLGDRKPTKASTPIRHARGGQSRLGYSPVDATGGAVARGIQVLTRRTPPTPPRDPRPKTTADRAAEAIARVTARSRLAHAAGGLPSPNPTGAIPGGPGPSKSTAARDSGATTGGATRPSADERSGIAAVLGAPAAAALDRLSALIYALMVSMLVLAAPTAYRRLRPYLEATYGPVGLPLPQPGRDPWRAVGRSATLTRVRTPERGASVPVERPRPARAPERRSVVRPVAVESPAPAPAAPRKRHAPWQAEEVMTGLMIAAEAARRQDRGLTCRLLQTLRADDPRIPSWSVVDRAARKAGSTGGQWVREAREAHLAPVTDLATARQIA